MTNLAGLHDRESTALGITDTWVLDTVALSEQPTSVAYHPGYEWICRANWGYGSTGTLPESGQHGEYVARLSRYVAGSLNCHRWIIGNEPNLPREWPYGQPIFPHQYAEVYALARRAIRATFGHFADDVLIAAPGPWNDQLKYSGNPSGDWVQYFKDVISIVGDECDGYSLHAYTHGYNVALITSEARMQSPFQSRRYEFRTYQDYMAAIPLALRHLPVYITEANGNGPWKAVGLIPAMLGEIDAWNKQSTHRIHCVIFYRFPKYDDNAEFAIEGKADVTSEYIEAVGRGYSSPVNGSAIVNQVFLPSTPNQSPSIVPTPDLPPRDIDPRATARGVTVQTPPIAPGQAFWRVVAVRWYDEQESQGRHHIYVEARNEHGELQIGRPFKVLWPSGSHTEYTNGGRLFDAGNFPMSKSLNEFSVLINDGEPSEVVKGIGMGADGNSGIHTSTGVWFELVTMPAATQPAPVEPTTPAQVPALAHPVANPQYRRVTQVFGARPEYYSQFKIDDVPLQGHEGIDFGTPVGTLIQAVDGGRVAEVADQGDTGYGRYIKIIHSWGETVYAHLYAPFVFVGDSIAKGVVIGTSGNTGNADGPHLHFGMRINPYNRQDGWGGYVDPAPYLINVAAPLPVDTGPFIPTQPTQPQEKQPPARQSYLAWFRQYGTQFGIEWHLLAALAYNENKYQVQPPSHKGALGLMQFMPDTWADMQVQLGVTDILDPEQSIKAAAYYLAQIRSYLIKHRKMGVDWVLAGYNWGMGHAAQGSWEQVPPETKRWMDLITETSEALRRWEDGW